MTGRIEPWLLAAEEQPNFDGFKSDDFEVFELPTPEQQLEKSRSDVRKGLTDKQRLFLFGKLGGFNDKDAALAAGYSVSVAENTKQRIWKPQVRTEYVRSVARRTVSVQKLKSGIATGRFINASRF